MRLSDRHRAVTLFSWAALLFLTLPMLIVLPLSVTDSNVLEMPQHGISFRNWAALFTDPAWSSSIWQSLAIAVAATILAATAGTLCALGCWRLASRVSEAVRLLMLVPLIVPSIVYAVGIYRFYAQFNLLGTFSGVILAHAVTGMPYVIITVSAALANMDRRLEQAARSLGASRFQTIRHVIVPSIGSGIVSGAIFAFIHSWDELVVVLFIASREVMTLPRLIWNSINESLDPRIAAMAVLLMIISVTLLLIEYLWAARRDSLDARS